MLSPTSPYWAVVVGMITGMMTQAKIIKGAPRWPGLLDMKLLPDEGELG